MFKTFEKHKHQNQIHQATCPWLQKYNFFQNQNRDASYNTAGFSRIDLHYFEEEEELKMRRKAIFITKSIASLVCIIFVIALAGCSDDPSDIQGPTLLRGVHHRNWMSIIDGSKLLSQINIPGTHESCTRYNSCGGGEGQCQGMPYSDQLKWGARILDLRLHYHHSIVERDVFRIRHDVCFCYTSSSHLTEVNLDYVLDDCIKFLDAYPTETIILLIQQASKSHENKAFSGLLESDRYLNNSAYKDRIYLGKCIPTLDEVRGKMVWVRRYTTYDEQGNPDDKEEGINFQDWIGQNAYFEYGDINGITVKIQDYYDACNAYMEAKWELFKKAAEESVEHPEYLVLNLSSAVGGLPGVPIPGQMAAQINPRLIEYFTDSNTRGKNYDWIIMDYMTSELSAKVLQSNPEFHQM